MNSQLDKESAQRQEIVDNLGDLAHVLKVLGKNADSLTCTQAAIWIAGEERADTPSSLAKPDFELLSKALGNTAACLGDALAIYNKVAGEEVFKNAGPALADENPNTSSEHARERIDAGPAATPSVAVRGDSTLLSEAEEHSVADCEDQPEYSAGLVKRLAAALASPAATWNAAVERCATEAENTPTTLCQNGDFLSERCAKAIRFLKTVHTPAAKAMPESGFTPILELSSAKPINVPLDQPEAGQPLERADHRPSKPEVAGESPAGDTHYTPPTTERSDLELLKVALGNTAACLGDVLAIYNKVVGEQVFKNADTSSASGRWERIDGEGLERDRAPFFLWNDDHLVAYICRDLSGKRESEEWFRLDLPKLTSHHPVDIRAKSDQS